MGNTFGSVQNMMAANSKPGTPVVGEGATMVMYTDRSPFTVIEVSKSGKRCKVQADKSRRTDSNGMSECQTYEFERDPEGTIYELRLTKKGWTHRGTRFLIGHRLAYHDFSF